MAFGDYQFIRTKMSDSLKVYLQLDTYQGEGFQALADEQINLGNKLSCRALNEGHTVSVSITGGEGTDNQNLILSAFGDDLDDCSNQLSALLHQLLPAGKNWHHIESEIKNAEKEVASIIRASMNK